MTKMRLRKLWTVWLPELLHMQRLQVVQSQLSTVWQNLLPDAFAHSLRKGWLDSIVILKHLKLFAGN